MPDSSYLGKNLLVFDDVLIGGDEHVEFTAAKLWHQRPPQGWRALHKNKLTYEPQSFTSNPLSACQISCHPQKHETSADLVSNFNNRWRPLVKFINPIGQSPVKKEEKDPF